MSYGKMRSVAVWGLVCFASLGMTVSALHCYVSQSVSTGYLRSGVETCALGEVCMVRFTNTNKATDGQGVETYRTCIQTTAQTKMDCYGIGTGLEVRCFCNTDGCNAEWMYTAEDINTMLAPAHRPTICWLSFTAMLFALLMVS